MTAVALLATLEARGIRIRVVGDRLRLAPKAAVTPDLLAEVRWRKPELLRLLAGRREVTVPAECSLCGGVIAPYLFGNEGSLQVICTGCRAWTAVAEVPQ